MRDTMTANPPAVRPTRGWSHSALQQARIGRDPWGVYWSEDAAATLLPIASVEAPREYPWTMYVPRVEHFSALGERAGLDGREAWGALVEHDEAHEQLLALTLLDLRYSAAVKFWLRESAKRNLSASRGELGDYLRRCLSARVDMNPALGCLHGPAELGFVHLAARLLATHDLPSDLQPHNDLLVRALDDLGNRDKLLRVCELSGAVFRGRKTATRLDVHRGRKLPTLPPSSGIVAVSFGPLWLADPLQPAASAPRYHVQCRECDLLFTATRLDATCCARCVSGARRTRRSRADSSTRPARPRRSRDDRVAFVLLIEDDDIPFESVAEAEAWIARNIDPRHSPRMTIQTIEGYTQQRAWPRRAA